MWYRIARGAVRVGALCYLRIQVRGGEKMPRAGGVIVACNHRSYLDPPIVAVSFRRQVRFLAKAALFRIPLFGRLIASLGSVPITRGRPDRAGFKRAEAILRSGQALLVFPEGTRSPDARLLPGEAGVGLLVLRTQAAVLPMAIIGSERAMPPHSPIIRPAKVRVRVGELLSFAEYAGRPINRESAGAVTERIMREIAALLGEPPPGAI